MWQKTDSRSANPKENKQNEIETQTQQNQTAEN